MVLQQITSTRNFPSSEFKPFGNSNSNSIEPYKINKKEKKRLYFLSIPPQKSTSKSASGKKRGLKISPDLTVSSMELCIFSVRNDPKMEILNKKT